MTKIAIERTFSYDSEEVSESLAKLLERLGGWEAFFSPNDKILLKPNLLSARQPEKGVTTNPSVIREIAKSLLEFGAEVAIGDSPGGAHKGVQRVFDNTGMTAVSEELSIPIVNFEIAGAHKIKSKGYILKITKALDEFDHILNVPRMKTHGLMTYTGAVKNMFGVVPGFGKSNYHKEYPSSKAFAGIICELFYQVIPTLTIMDAINGMEGDGPSSGDLREDTNMLIASSDAVALDTVVEKIIGLTKPSPIMEVLRNRQIGETDIKNIDLIDGSVEEFILDRPFKLPPSAKISHLIPDFMGKIVSKLIWIRPALDPDKCITCNKCKDMCPVNAIEMNPNAQFGGAKMPVFDYKLCILCLCCHEICPEKAIILERSRLARRF